MAMIKCGECGADVSTKADKCPSCGAPVKKRGIGLKLVGGLVGFLVLAMCTAALSEKDEEVTTEVTAAKATAEAAPPAAPERPKAKSSLGDYLSFGKPTLKPVMGSMSEVLVEVQNKGSMGITCMVTATFKKGGEILGTANGAVNDVPSGGTKTAQLMSTDSVEGFDTVKLETSGCLPSNAKATVAGAGTRSGDPLMFGKPTVKNVGGFMSEVLVEATNTTDRKLTCTVTATFKKGDEIIDTATGAVNEIQSKGTKTAQLMSTSVLGKYDNVILEASACF